LTWSLGGCIVEAEREKFSDFLKNLSGLIMPSSSLYENFFNVDGLTFVRWDEKVPAYVAPANKKFSAILVPTVDTIRYAWLLNQIMILKKPALFCGDSGTAKTVTVQSCFRSLDADRY
jgi:dynein heavy chain